MGVETALEGKPLWWGLGIGAGLVIAALAAVHFLVVDSETGLNKKIAAKDAELVTAHQ